MNIKQKKFVKLHIYQFPSSKIDFCPFLKWQKMDFGQNKFREMDLFDFTFFFGLDFFFTSDLTILYTYESLILIVFFIILLGNKTFIEIGNLTHFSKYTLTIKACHKSLNDTHWNALNPFIAKASYDENHKARCSKIQSSDFLTAKKEGADDIPSDSVTTNSDSNNGMNNYPQNI